MSIPDQGVQLPSMNFLAHAYLSFGDPSILVGNMIGDFVKGKKFAEYPADVGRGILMHRAIDQFTDLHPATRRAGEVFRPAYGRYCGVFVDVAYDHFLSVDPLIFPGNSLFDFSIHTYDLVRQHQDLLPETFKPVFLHMSSHNWLWNYRTREGTYRSFGGIIRRARYLSDPVPAVHALEGHYSELKECYGWFFPELIRFSKQYLHLSML